MWRKKIANTDGRRRNAVRPEGARGPGAGRASGDARRAQARPAPRSARLPVPSQPATCRLGGGAKPRKASLSTGWTRRVWGTSPVPSGGAAACPACAPVAVLCSPPRAAARPPALLAREPHSRAGNLVGSGPLLRSEHHGAPQRFRGPQFEKHPAGCSAVPL